MAPTVGRPGDDGAALVPLSESILQWGRPDGRMTDTTDEEDVARQPTEMGPAVDRPDDTGSKSSIQLMTALPAMEPADADGQDSPLISWNSHWAQVGRMPQWSWPWTGPDDLGILGGTLALS